MTEPDSAFRIQSEVRGPWRRYLDALVPLRPELHRYCSRLTGSVWDGEDLAQDALLRVFAMLGKVDRDLENPRGYLLRTATHLWIDRVRRRERERAVLRSELAASDAPTPGPEQGVAVRDAAEAVLGGLAPRERAAFLLKDVFDLSLAETASILKTSVGAVKSALHRGRRRISEDDGPPACQVPVELVDRLAEALVAADLDAVERLCRADLTVDMVGGNTMEGFDESKVFFEHCLWGHPKITGVETREGPHWERVLYHGEPIVLGFRWWKGDRGLAEIHRLDAIGDRIGTLRCYCFAPDTLRWVAEELGIAVLPRLYRSPSPPGIEPERSREGRVPR